MDRLVEQRRTQLEHVPLYAAACEPSMDCDRWSSRWPLFADKFLTMRRCFTETEAFAFLECSLTYEAGFAQKHPLCHGCRNAMLEFLRQTGVFMTEEVEVKKFAKVVFDHEVGLRSGRHDVLRDV